MNTSGPSASSRASGVHPLLARSSGATPADFASVPWLSRLEAAHRELAQDAMRVVEVVPGEVICRVGRQPTYWFGLVDGLLKMSNDSAQGMPVTFAGMTSGGWFGEGTALKREPYRYNVEALRASRVAGIPLETFHELLERSIGFNRFILQQLNERLGQFIAAREIDRLTDPDSRVARSLGALFHPILYPGVGSLLRITQQELGYLVGLSRQRVNKALQSLEGEGLIRVEYRGVRVLDLQGLQQRVRAPAAS